MRDRVCVCRCSARTFSLARYCCVTLLTIVVLNSTRDTTDIIVGSCMNVFITLGTNFRPPCGEASG